MQFQKGALVETETEDRIRLHGFWQQPHTQSHPAESSSAEIAKEDHPNETRWAWILVHGVGSNFYGSSLLSFVANKLIFHRQIALRVNTRGHDPVSFASTPGGPSRQGAAYEDVSQSLLDLSAWCQWLRTHHKARIGLIGHSLGAVKCLYSLSQRELPVDAVIAISPPRLAYHRFLEDRDAAVFQACIAEAQHYVDAGKPEHLMKGRFPFPLLITAASYLDKYGPAEKYDYLPWVSKIQVPSLFVFGEKELIEGKTSFWGAPESLLQALAGRPLSEVEIVPGADHFYTSGRDLLSQCIERWIARI